MVKGGPQNPSGDVAQDLKNQSFDRFKTWRAARHNQRKADLHSGQRPLGSARVSVILMCYLSQMSSELVPLFKSLLLGSAIAYVGYYAYKQWEEHSEKRYVVDVRSEGVFLLRTDIPSLCNVNQSRRVKAQRAAEREQKALMLAEERRRATDIVEMVKRYLFDLMDAILVRSELSSFRAGESVLPAVRTTLRRLPSQR
jgi:hypothetical protein